MSITRRNSSGVSRVAGTAVPTPALLTRTSTRPSSATVSLDHARAVLGARRRRRSTATQRRPSASTRSAVSSSRSARRAPMATSAPASARPTANAAPRPDEAPVTTATLPSSRKRSRTAMVRHANEAAAAMLEFPRRQRSFPGHKVPAMLSLFPPGSALDADGMLLVGGCRADALARRVRHAGARRRRARAAGAGARVRATSWPPAGRARGSSSPPRRSRATAVQRVMVEEGLGLDVAGGGEIVTALQGGRRPGADRPATATPRATTRSRWPSSTAIGLVVVDNADDVDRLEATVPPGATQDVLVRVIPGVTADTHAHVLTGHEGSKFGLPAGGRRAADRAHRAQPAAAHARPARARRLADPRRRAVRGVGRAGRRARASSRSTTSAAASARATRTPTGRRRSREYLDALDRRRARAPAGRGRADHRARPQHGRRRRGDALPRRHRQARGDHVRRRRRRDGRQPRGRAVRPALRGRPRRPARRAPAASRSRSSAATARAATCWSTASALAGAARRRPARRPGDRRLLLHDGQQLQRQPPHPGGLRGRRRGPAGGAPRDLGGPARPRRRAEARRREMASGQAALAGSRSCGASRSPR